jgi:aminopeptidase N
MSHRTLSAATEFGTEAWVDSTMARKAWGYAAERSPSTHPVAGSAALDAMSALQDFDGISYAKGAATLRQLIAHIGDDAFIAGVSDYLRQHSFGNGTLADFMGFMEKASGKDLASWTRAWLMTAGVDVISVDKSSGTVDRTVPRAFPADRPHTFDVAGFTGGAEVFRVPVTATGNSTSVPELAAAPDADLVVPNAADLTWATVTLDAASTAAVPQQLGQVPDPQARAVVWVSLIDGVCLGTLDPRVMVRTVGAAWPREDNASILNRTAGSLLGRVIPTFLPPEDKDAAEQVVARAAAEVLAGAEPGSTRALVAARTVARTSTDEPLLRDWADGKNRPQGLEDDSDFGWIVVRNLTSRGLAGRELIEATREQDDTLQGRLSALMAGASMPSVEAKAWAWAELTTNRERSNYELNALAQGFWASGDPDVLRPYAARYFSDVPPMSAWVGDDALARVATLAYPSRVVEPQTAELSRAALERDDLTAAVRRSVVDAQSELEEALRSRATFG